MKNLKPILLIIILLSFLCNAIKAKDATSESLNLVTNLSCSYIVGAQVFNDNILYHPGIAFNYSTSFPLNKHIDIGAGAGYLSLTGENFVPVYIEFAGFKSKKDNTPFTTLQLGYSMAGNKLTFDMNNYDMKGGIYFNWGGGYKWKISKSFSLLTSINYTQQFAKLAYTISANNMHQEAVDFAMLRFSIGILKH